MQRKGSSGALARDLAHHLALAAACAALVLAPAPAAAQKTPSAPPTLPSTTGGQYEIVIRVCNNTGDPARVALSYEPVGAGRFYNEGWYRVAPGACEELARTDNGFIYGYAEVENQPSRSWSGDHGLCVVYPGPYAFWSDDAATCASGQELRQFVVMHTDEFGAYEWSLDPGK
jgi:uncharacterized membrane protein